MAKWVKVPSSQVLLSTCQQGHLRWCLWLGSWCWGGGVGVWVWVRVVIGLPLSHRMRYLSCQTGMWVQVQGLTSVCHRFVRRLHPGVNIQRGTWPSIISHAATKAFTAAHDTTTLGNRGTLPTLRNRGTLTTLGNRGTRTTLGNRWTLAILGNSRTLATLGNRWTLI